MAAEITQPVYVRVGNYGEARWGEITFKADGCRIEEADFRQALAGFLRGAADILENPPEEEVQDAAADG